MRRTVIIRLEVEGENAANVSDAIDSALDAGVIQEAIGEFIEGTDHEGIEIVSATCEEP